MSPSMKVIATAPKDGTVVLGARYAPAMPGGAEAWQWFAPIKWFQISQWHPANWGHASQHHAEPPFWGATHWVEMPTPEEKA